MKLVFGDGGVMILGGCLIRGLVGWLVWFLGGSEDVWIGCLECSNKY